MTRTIHVLLITLVLASPAFAQPPAPPPTPPTPSTPPPTDPFPQPIGAGGPAIEVGVVEFAAIPDIEGVAARMMLLLDEPGTRRLFVNDMRGPLYTVSYDGKSVAPYLDINGSAWGVSVHSTGRERGFQSFAFHPQFNQRGAQGFGKLYTMTDTTNTTAKADFMPLGGEHTHDTVLLEWTAKNPAAEAYDGGPPRELIRFEQPFANHNAGQIAFNPLASSGDADYGLLYIGFADGGNGGDPLNLAQNRGAAFGKILRIDPLGSNSANGKYGIPAKNPFASDSDPNTLGEIYAWGVRNPQRLSWDPKTRNLYVADIGQGTVEELSIVTEGANLGWNKWEGSFTFVSRSAVSAENPRADSSVTYPIVEYGHWDPLLGPRSAVTMGYVYRASAVPQLMNLLVFGDIPSGEVFCVNGDTLPKGGQDPIRRVVFKDTASATKTFLQLIKEKNAAQGKEPAARADLRFGQGPDGQIFLINKGDGVVRMVAPAGAGR